MRHKSFCLFLAGLTVFLILKAEVSANDCLGKNKEASAQRFIIQYYEDLKEGDKSKIKQYFVEKLDKETLRALRRSGRIVSQKPLEEEDLEQMIHSGKLLSETLEKIDFLEMSIISQKPLIIEVGVIERNKPGYSIPPEELFILKNVTDCKWKIIEITLPGLP